MNFKKRMGKFFTLTHKSDAGFTLVELIVVIAILAILAGVAVPAYSGYIEKSKCAADETLLAAVNKAFAAACVSAGTDVWLVNDADLAITNKVVNGISSVDTLDANSLATAQEAFVMFYVDENPNAQFQVYSGLQFDADKKVFVGVDEEAVIEALKQLIGNSNFNGNLEELTGDVGEMIDVLAGYLEDEGAGALVGTGFDAYLTDVLGLTEEDKADTNKMANAAVLYLAHSASGMTADNIYGAKGTLAEAMIGYAQGGSLDLNNLIPELAANTDSGLASYAMLYATAKALALQEGTDSDAYKALETADINNPQTVLSAVGDVFENVSDENIESYFAEDGNFDKDMDAYFQTLQAVNSKEGELMKELNEGNLLTENETVQNLLSKLQG